MRAAALWLLLLLAACEQSPAAKPKPVTVDWDRDPATQAYIDPEHVPSLQKIASKACLCTRKRGDRTECWSSFWKEANGFRNSGEWATACGPGSTAGIDFERSLSAKGEGGMTVTTQFGYGACSAEEVPVKKAEYENKTKMRGC